MKSNESEYIKVKVFLYKYTPVFSQVSTNKDIKVSDLQVIKDKIKSLSDAKAKLIESKKEKEGLSANSSEQASKVQTILDYWKSVISAFMPSDITSAAYTGSYDDYEKMNPTSFRILNNLNLAGTPLRNTAAGLFQPPLKNTVPNYWQVVNRVDSIIQLYIKDNGTNTNKMILLYDEFKKLSVRESLTIGINGWSALTADDKRACDARTRMYVRTYEFIDTYYNVKRIKDKGTDLSVDDKIVALDKEIATLEESQVAYLGGLNRVRRFSMDLDEQYLSKVDVSDFVLDYEFTHSISSGINWSINFNNVSLTENDLDNYFIKKPAGDLLNLLSGYQTEDDGFGSDYAYEQSIIENTMRVRAEKVTNSLTQEATDAEIAADNDLRKPSILLSDLIQKYDFMSCYLYKSTTPLSDETLKEKVSSSVNSIDDMDIESVLVREFDFSNEFNGFVMSTSFNTAAGSMNTLSVSGIGCFGIFDRTRVLYSPTAFTSTIYDQVEMADPKKVAIFSSLFSDKHVLDIVNILLRDVYRISSFVGNALDKFNDYNAVLKTDAEKNYIANLEKLENVKKFAEQQRVKTVLNKKEIQANRGPQALADFIIHITSGGDDTSPTYWDKAINKLDTLIKNAKSNLNSLVQHQTLYGRNFSIYGQKGEEAFTLLQKELKNINISYFFDITRLKVENNLQTNIFTIAPFLYASTMARRGFFNRNVDQTTADDIATGIFATDQGSLGATTNDYFLSLTTKPDLFFSPINLDVNVDDFKPYFLFLENGFSNFEPTLKTPNEILDEVKKMTFIEIFESSSGTLNIRTPKYNDISTVLLSDNYNIISTNYKDSAIGLVTKEKLSYQQDLIRSLPFNIYSYVNGKLLMQYGLNETNVSANPNVKYTISKDPNMDISKAQGIFNYCRFYLELNNASQKTCSINMEYTTANHYVEGNAVQIFQPGNLFYDSRNSKISYITSVQKRCVVAGTLSMIMSGTYVRDAWETSISGLSDAKNIFFRELPELKKLNAQFSTATQTSSNLNKQVANNLSSTLNPTNNVSTSSLVKATTPIGAERSILE